MMEMMALMAPGMEEQLNPGKAEPRKKFGIFGRPIRGHISYYRK